MFSTDFLLINTYRPKKQSNTIDFFILSFKQIFLFAIYEVSKMYSQFTFLLKPT